MAGDYLDAAFQDLLDEDGLLVMARGLGKQRLIARFLRMHAETAPGACLLCLNMSTSGDNQLLTRALLAEGMAREQLPRVITNDIVSAQRQALYKQGGVFLVTSRILIVDLLANKVDVARLRGMVVNHAERVTDTSTEAFIIRIYRQRNRTGFLKAFSDEPEQLLQGFGRLERVLKYCYVRRVYLWPRYHVAVKEFLARHEPEVVEMAQALTPAMKAIQQAILVAMDGCLKELRRTTTVDASTLELKLENGIFKAFHHMLRRQLDPEWHRISPKTKQLVQDLSVLRQLLDFMLRYDAVTFYSYLIALQRVNATQKYPSDWLSSVAADRLYHHAKSRVYRLREVKVAGGPKVKKEKGSKDKEGGGKAAAAAKELALDVVLEENPKWKLLLDVLAEIKRDHTAKHPRPPAPAVPAPPSAPETTGPSWEVSSSSEDEDEDEGKDKEEGKEPAKDQKKATLPKILILVRDERTCAQLWSYLRHGGRYLLERRFKHFLEQLHLNKDTASASSTAAPADGGKGNNKRGGRGAGADTGKASLALQEKRLLAKEHEEMNKKGERSRGKKEDDVVEILDVDVEEDAAGKDEGGGFAWENEEEEEDDDDDSDSSSIGSTGKAPKKKGGKKGAKTKQAAATKGRKGRVPTAAAAAKGRGKKGEEGGGGGGKGGKGGGKGMGLRKILPAGAPGGGGAGGKAKGKRKRGEADEQARTTLARTEEFFNRIDMATRIEAAGEGEDKWGHVLMFTYSQAYTNMGLLEETRPGYIVLYDPDTQFVREVEVHQARRPADETLSVYFMVYEESVEEQRYLTALTKEKEAFERLVQEKRHMVMPANVYESILPTPGSYIDTLVADTRALTRGQPARLACTKVVVDVREFRSSLPNMLHQGGLEVIPETLAIGDFVLTPEIVVERKSVSDLFGSFASGRLFSQVEGMLRYYKVATLLIEFQDDKAFSLQTVGEISPEIQLNSIVSKLVLLTLHFPALRILWSRNSHHTVALFKGLKQNNAPVDVQKALTAGGGGGDEDEDAGRHLAASDFLLKLPGVTVNNYRLIMNKVENLAALSRMSVEELHPILESEAAAKKLYEFFHFDANESRS